MWNTQVRQRDVSPWYHCDIWPSSLAQEPESHLCPLLSLWWKSQILKTVKRTEQKFYIYSDVSHTHTHFTHRRTTYAQLTYPYPQLTNFHSLTHTHNSQISTHIPHWPTLTYTQLTHTHKFHTHIAQVYATLFINRLTMPYKCMQHSGCLCLASMPAFDMYYICCPAFLLFDCFICISVDAS